MNNTQKLGFIMAQALAAQCRVAMMVEQNTRDSLSGRPRTFQPHDIENVPHEFGLMGDDVVRYLTLTPGD